MVPRGRSGCFLTEETFPGLGLRWTVVWGAVPGTLFVLLIKKIQSKQRTTAISCRLFWKKCWSYKRGKREVNGIVTDNEYNVVLIKITRLWIHLYLMKYTLVMIALFWGGEINVFHLWIMSIKYDFWNCWVLHFGQFKLNKWGFFGFCFKKIVIKHACPKPKSVWVATENINNLTSKSKFLLTQDIIINNWNYAAPHEYYYN